MNKVRGESDAHMERMNVWHYRVGGKKQKSWVIWSYFLSYHTIWETSSPFQHLLRETDFWVINIRSVKWEQERLLLFFRHDTVTWEVWQSFRMAALHPDSSRSLCSSLGNFSDCWEVGHEEYLRSPWGVIKTSTYCKEIWEKPFLTYFHLYERGPYPLHAIDLTWLLIFGITSVKVPSREAIPKGEGKTL